MRHSSRKEANAFDDEQDVGVPKPTSPNPSEGSHALTSFRDQTSGHREIETTHPWVTGYALPYNPISIGNM